MTVEKPSALATRARPMPVFPAVPSTITPAGRERSPRDRVANDIERGPVLHRAAGIHEFRLAENAAARRFRRRAQFDQRSLADGVDHIGGYGHADESSNWGGGWSGQAIIVPGSYRFKRSRPFFQSGMWRSGGRFPPAAAAASKAFPPVRRKNPPGRHGRSRARCKDKAPAAATRRRYAGNPRAPRQGARPRHCRRRGFCCQRSGKPARHWPAIPASAEERGLPAGRVARAAKRDRRAR